MALGGAAEPPTALLPRRGMARWFLFDIMLHSGYHASEGERERVGLAGLRLPKV